LAAVVISNTYPKVRALGTHRASEIVFADGGPPPDLRLAVGQFFLDPQFSLLERLDHFKIRCRAAHFLFDLPLNSGVFEVQCVIMRSFH
jgi:hypothetical protein